MINVPLSFRQALSRIPFLRDAVRFARAQHIKIAMSHQKFSLDRFAGDEEGRLISISGWLRPEADRAMQLQLRIDGQPSAGLLRQYRHDVAAAFPDEANIVRSGFIGDLVVPESIADGESFALSLCAVAGKVVETLAERRVTLRADRSPPIKVRRLDIGDLLQDPLTGAPVGSTGLAVAGVPHFHPPGYLPLVRLSESGTTHPYSSWAQTIIDDSRGPILDFGAGVQVPERLRDHVVNLDAIHFPYVDVASSCSNLPFRSGVFDAVISQAVFEHLNDPFHSAREILRVLRPGGVVMIDTAFMQPFHGDPDHYFNMTTAGLRRIMAGFEIVELGVRPYQFPSWGLVMQLETILPFVASPRWRKYLEELLRRLRKEGGELDASLGEVGREVLAAGVYVVARKPG